jgi:hypothetical protein
LPAKVNPEMLMYIDIEKEEALVNGVNVGRGIIIPSDVYVVMNRTPRYKNLTKKENLVNILTILTYSLEEILMNDKYIKAKWER